MPYQSLEKYQNYILHITYYIFTYVNQYQYSEGEEYLTLER